jgi:DNA-binding transcriptional LysR family regulator
VNVENFDLNLLTSLDALLAERHVSRAAARVGLTQPAMSNALARLRSALDDPLLVRAGPRMVLTARAQALVEPVRRAMGLLREIVGHRDSGPVTGARTLVIGATEYAEQLLLPRLLPFWLRAVDQLRVVMRRLPALFQAPEDELQAGLLDLAVGFFPAAPSLRPGILSQELYSEDNVVVARKRHPSVGRRLTIKQYAALQHIGIFYQAEGASLIDRLLLDRGLQRRTPVQVPHLMSAVSLAAQTDLVTTIPRRLGVEVAKRFPVRTVELPLTMPVLRFAVLWHLRSDRDPSLQVVRRHVAEAACGIPARPRARTPRSR